MTVAEHREATWNWWTSPDSFRLEVVNRHGWNPHYREDPDLVGRSPKELVDQYIISVYFGMYGHDDRETIEPFGFLKSENFPTLPPVAGHSRVGASTIPCGRSTTA
eukprot:scaffold456_cov171-Amphora_coffeaeformis.AAC.1